MRQSLAERSLSRCLLPLLLAAPVMAQTWAQRTPTASPSARSSNSNSMAYDPARGVSVLFGGYPGTPVALADTWEWDGTSWTQRTVANGPVGRWGHGLVQDTRRGRAVMFGGFVASTGQYTDETWEWDGSTWLRIQSATAPSPRCYSGMAYDSVLGRVVLFGGFNGTTECGDTWTFDGATWAQAAPTVSPSVRQGAALAFDSARNQTVLFGGGTASAVFGDTWTFDGTNWTQRTPSTSPSARQFGSMCYDAPSGRSVIFGGADAAFAVDSSECWSWDGANWSLVSAGGPAPRHGAAIACDLQRGQTVLFGGLGGSSLADTWLLPSPGLRTMSTLTMPEVGQQSTFQYSYPPSASGHFYWQLLTSHMIGSVPVQVPGFVTVGQVRVNFLDVLYEWTGVLDASGSAVRSVSIPNDPIFAGFAFDVQAIDIDFRTNTIWLSRNDVEVRIGQGSAGSTFTEVTTTGQAQVIAASQNVQVLLPAGAIAADSPMIVEVDSTPEPWVTDANYTAAPIDIRLSLNPDDLLTDEGFEIEIPIGSLPLDEIDPSSPGALNGSVFMYVAPGVGVALPTRIETSPTLVGGLRRAFARVSRGLASVIRTGVRATVWTYRNVIRPVVVFTVNVVVRIARCVLGGFQAPPPQLSLRRWNAQANDWGSYSPPAGAQNRVAFVIPGIVLFGSSIADNPTLVRQLGYELASALMPYTQANLYDSVYLVSYRDLAGVRQVGDGIRSLVNGIAANEIDVIGYSMGGLIARWAAERNSAPAWNSGNGKISRMVTIGTPHEGTPVAALQSMMSRMPILSGFQNCYGQHLTDLATGSWVVEQLRVSAGMGAQTRLYAFAGTRSDNYECSSFGCAGTLVQALLLNTETDGIVPRYSALSSTLVTKADVRQRAAFPYNHIELVGDASFLRSRIMPCLIEDRPGAVPVADFTATPTTGTAPLSVAFSNSSTSGATAWRWDFNNDGVVDSTLQSPTFVYTTPGTYSVRLDVDYPARAPFAGGTVTKVRTDYIVVQFVGPNPALNMVAIQPGTFQMGSTVIGGTSAPVHAVTITRPFWVGKYEVTQAEYQAVRGFNPSVHQGPSYPNAPQRPVESVPWNGAMAYCSTLTATEAAAGRIPAGYQYRLPTEAEWEYVCRAGTTTEWNTGASLTTAQANFDRDQTTVVGSYPANPWGLFDTHGNVREWCLDSWNGSANYPSSAVSDPYVSSGPDRVYRGGNFFNFNASADMCRSALRVSSPPGFTFGGSIGFRVVLAPVLVP